MRGGAGGFGPPCAQILVQFADDVKDSPSGSKAGVIESSRGSASWNVFIRFLS